MREPISVGLIGAGGIAQDVVAAIREHDGGANVRIVGALVRPGRAAAAQAQLPGIDIVETLDALLARQPKLVAEVAGQSAVAEYGEAVLRAGHRPSDHLGRRAGRSGAAGAAQGRGGSGRQPHSASGGCDRRHRRGCGDAGRGAQGGALPFAQAAGRLARLARRTGRRPRQPDASAPCSTAAPPGEAALRFPQNANVAAALALAGLGFDATEVELVADPDAPGNVHEIEAEGAAGRFAIQLQGKPSRSNPKTSALAAMSVARALLNENATIVI